MEWLISANGKMYNNVEAFDEFGYIYWRQRANYEVGDTVYIYATKPYMKVMFKTIVEKVTMSSDEIIDDKKYWYDIEEYETSLSRKYARLRLIERVDSEKLSLYESMIVYCLNVLAQLNTNSSRTFLQISRYLKADHGNLQGHG